MTTDDQPVEPPPVPPVRPDPDLVWQVEGDEPTIERYRAQTSRVAEQARGEDNDE